MKAKLIKTGNDYILRDLSGEVLGITIGEINGKLSLKNCQAIERGYDLNELAEKHINHEPHTTYILQRKFDFIDGFRKALGILGDKRFTDKDLDKAIEYGHKSRMPFNEDWYDEFIQSLQQNEWEVEIIMECTQCQSYGYVSECRDNCNKKFLQPKLDADGCLILKRV